ncbi:Lipoprotein-releasing system ATP-binding protein LolD 1 [Durusdinium trenchii]|uniref:Lipoprotein-releasing system ATP-binding protein LolD 1 n=1 Tax=Durusdinium trenchii TaxID=1381693 RepID=A0ABP0IWW5_9DINO
MLRVKQGDDGAYSQLLDRYRDRLVGIFTNMFGDADLGEDLAQEVFLRIYRARNGYEPTAKFSTWLFQIANNLASNSRRTKGRRKEVQLRVEDSGGQPTRAATDVAVEKSGLMPTRQFDKQELQERVRSALETLNERQRLAVLLHKFEGMSYADIAASMELTPQAVKSLLARARENLRVILENYLSRLTAEDRDNLVAYLDGELPDDVTTRVESVLAQSNVARHDVELLARTYDLLDELPRPKASPDFTERTLVTAKLEEARPDFRQTQTYRLLQRSTVLVAWFGILLLCGSLSYAVTAIWIPRPVDELLENYPVIERLDVYTEVGSVEPTVTPNRIRLFLIGAVLAAIAIPPILVQGEAESRRRRDDSRKQIAGLTSQDRNRLNRNFKVFNELSDDERRQLRELHALLEEDRQKRQGELTQVMEDYYAWLKTIEPYQRDALAKASDSTERIALIQEVLEEQRMRIAKRRIEEDEDWQQLLSRLPGGNSVPTMSEDSLHGLLTRVHDQFANDFPGAKQRQLAELRQMADASASSRRGELTPEERLHRLVYHYELLKGIRELGASERTSRLFTWGSEPLLRELVESIGEPTIAEFVLSKDSRFPTRMKFNVVIMHSLVHELYRQGNAAKAPSDAELRALFDQLPMPEQDQLLSLDAVDFRAELLRLHQEQTASVTMRDLLRLFRPPADFMQRTRPRGPRENDGPGGRPDRSDGNGRRGPIPDRRRPEFTPPGERGRPRFDDERPGDPPPNRNPENVQDLSKEFATVAGPLTVLNRLTVEMAAGDCLAITGPSGSGKSTLLYIIGLLDTPTAGEVVIRGEQPLRFGAAAQARFRSREIGFIFQDHHLLPQCSVLENVLIPTLAAGGAGAEEKARATALLERVGLAERTHHRPAQLSGGERQRVAVCRAMINQPSLVLADEPTGNLDRKTAETVGSLLLELTAEQQAMLICVTHSLELAERFPIRKELLDGKLVDVVTS